MSAVHYFVFSSGEYDEYRFGDICICDHAVSKGEWHAHFAAFEEGQRKRRQKDHQSFDEWYDSGGMDKLQRWEKKNDPVKTFQRLHKMKVLPALELHQ